MGNTSKRGVTLFIQKKGGVILPATFKEAQAFYHSKQWLRCAESIRKQRHYLCEKCGRPGSYVHHKIHLTIKNITDSNISLNPSNLELLCHDCHEKEHGRLKEKKVQRQIVFDSSGNPLVKQ